MVLGIVMMAAMLPTMIGLNEATQGGREREEARLIEARKQRGHLVAIVDLTQGTPAMREQVHNSQVHVGLDGKVRSVTHGNPGRSTDIVFYNCSFTSLSNPALLWFPSMVATIRIPSFHRTTPRD